MSLLYLEKTRIGFRFVFRDLRNKIEYESEYHTEDIESIIESLESIQIAHEKDDE